MIPAVLDARIARRDSRGFRLWLPVFLLWPFVFVLLGLALCISLIVDLVLILADQRYHHYSALLFSCIGLLTQTRGTLIDINGNDTIVKVRIV